MWKRKGLKKKTRVLLKQSYGSMVAVCFLIAMLTTAYSVSTTVFNFQISPGQPETDAAFSVSIPNSEVIIETIDTFLASTNLSAGLIMVPQTFWRWQSISVQTRFPYFLQYSDLSMQL